MFERSNSSGKSTRQTREKLGRNAELLAAIWLRLKGYKILEKRLRLKSGEIDLIAKRGKTIAFVEVKARQTVELGLSSVPDRSWNRIARSAQIWMSHKNQYSDHDWRYDLIIVRPRKLPVHRRDHWRPK